MLDFNVDEFIAKIEPAVQKGAEVLGTTAVDLWTVGIMKQYVDGIVDLITAVVSLITLVLCYYGGKWIITRKNKDYGEEAFVAFPIMVGVGTVLVFFHHLYQGLLHLIVPQYTLILEIISLM